MFIWVHLPAHDVTMVDVDTALKSAAIDRRKAKKGRDSSKPKRPGGSVGVEPFDPEVFRTKEVADTYSMWLVLIGSILTALLMRFAIMPGMGEPGPLLWLLPLSLVLILPTLHRLILPDEISDLYTGGNWFRAGMLWIFTWLSISIILVNPPLADISAPEAADVRLVFDEGEESEDLIARLDRVGNDIDISIEAGQSEGSMWLLLDVRDNVAVDDCSIIVQLVKNEQVLLNSTINGANTTAIAAYDDLVSGNRSIVSIVDEGSWSNPDMKLWRPTDVGIAVDLGVFDTGTYELRYRIDQPGDPWPLTTGDTVYKIQILPSQ